MTALKLLQKFKQYILVVSIPIVLYPLCFSSIDDRKIACPPPCSIYENYKQSKACRDSASYSVSICQKRCPVDCFKQVIEQDDENNGTEQVKISTDLKCLQEFMKKPHNYKYIDPKTGEEITAITENNQDILFSAVVEDRKNGICVDPISDSSVEKYLQWKNDENANKSAVPAIFDEDSVIDGLYKYASDKDVKKAFDSLYNYKIAACLYGSLIMCVYWIFEIIPLTVTAISPLFLFPLLGIQTSKIVAGFFFTDIIALFYGGLLVANAIEKVNLHRRLALFVLTLVGPKPVWILLAFMCITSFISMWISNVATTIMVLPIAVSVIDELKRNLDGQAEAEGVKKEGEEMEFDEEKSPMLGNQQKSHDPELIQNFKDRYNTQSMLKKSLIIAICYCASIGGTGMIMGTGPNAIFAGYMSTSGKVDVLSYGIFAFPMCWVMTFICWGTLWFCFLRTCKDQSEEELNIVRKIIQDKYAELGKMKFGEILVGICVFLMATLWITRKSWTQIDGLDTTDFKGKPYVKDSVVACFMLFLLFILPQEAPTCNSEDPLPKPILEFKQANSKLAWSVLFILGGGFAMANGVSVSGLATWISTKLGFLTQMSHFTVVFIAVTIIVFMTQATSNSSTISIFLPVLGSIAQATGMNPLLIMAPCTVAVSYAFMLPVSTPPNALCMGYGLQSKDLLRPGVVLVLLGIPLITIWTWVAGPLAFPSIHDPCADWLKEAEDPRFKIDPALNCVGQI